MSNKTNYLSEFTKGIIKENPTLVMLLGMCPTLAITTAAMSGLGMGLATTFVLVCTSTVISMLKNVIPSTVRLPAYIVIIAGFSTLVSILLKAYIPFLYDALGIYLSLIVVNCIVFGRAEMFASKNKVVLSIFDSLGMGLGFTLALTTIGSIRELFGNGTVFGIDLSIPQIEPVAILIQPAGGFFVLGIVIAVVNKIAKRKPPRSFGCDNCAEKSGCSGCDMKVKEES